MSNPDANPPSLVSRLGLWTGAVLAVVLWTGPLWGWSLAPDAVDAAGRLDPTLNRTAAVAALMAIWWITEAIPLGATALAPLALFPLGKIAPAADVARSFGSNTVFLFLGGFLLALAIESSGLHRRISLHFIRAAGGGPRRMMLGFMAASAVLSMWMSNTACTMMMLPIAVSTIETCTGAEQTKRRYGCALLLGLAYASSIGGLATPIGTPVNPIFLGFWSEEYPAAAQITFPGWMVISAPLTLVFTLCCWVWLALAAAPRDRFGFGGSEAIRQTLAELGPMRPSERRAGGMLACAAAAWVLREPVAGWGWAPLLGLAGDEAWVHDATVAMAAGAAGFIIPAGERPGRLLDETAFRRVPWGILLLFGGGLALGAGMKSAGLDALLGGLIASQLELLPPLGQTAAAAAGVTALTELTSNVATANMVLPLLAGAADLMGEAAAPLLLAATFAASCAFMLPVATPPNAIVYSSQYVRTADMLKYGFVLNCIGVVLVVAAIALAAPLLPTN